MRLTIIAVLAANIFIYTSCKKTDIKSSKTDECFTTNSAGNGAIIEGQYIVFYKNFDNLQASTLRVAQVSKDVLSESSISAAALRTSFTGDVRGFVANL